MDEVVRPGELGEDVYAFPLDHLKTAGEAGRRHVLPGEGDVLRKAVDSVDVPVGADGVR